MMRRAVLVLVILFLSARVVTAQGNGKPAIPPELPPFPCTNAQAERFRDEANTFLREHRDSGHAPTVLHNLVMLEKIGGNEDRVRATQFRLIMTYPKSMPSAHFVATCKDAEEYRDVVRHGVREFSSWLTSKKSAEAFNRSVELGLARFGEKFLDNEEFMIEAVVAAHVAEDHVAARRLPQFVQKKGKKATLEIVNIFAHPLMRTSQKLTALAELDADAPTAVCHEVLWDRLTETEQKELEPLRARLDYFCHSGEISRVRSTLKDCEYDDPQLLYLRIWSSLSLGKEEEAAAPLAKLNESHAGSKWTRQAEVLMRRGANVAKNINEQAELWDQAATKMRSSVRGVEATMQIDREGETFKHSGYLAIAPTERLFEVQVRSATETIIAFQATVDGAKLYTNREHERLELPAANTFPMFRWTDSKSLRPFNKQQVGFRFEMATADRFSNVIDKLVDFPYLRSKTTISATLGSALSAGYVPCAIERRGDLRTLTWIRPDARSGELTEWEFDFDSEARLRALRGPSIQVERICYADEPAWRTKRPAWPESPVRKIATFDATAFAKLMGAFAQMMETLSPSDEMEKEVAGGRGAVK